MSKVKYWAVLLATIFGSLTIAAPASADFDGRMNFAEYIWINYQIPSNTQAEVEDHCNCEGIVWNTFEKNDRPAKQVRYRNTDDDVAKVWYIKRDDDRWHVYDKAWCDPNSCLGP